MSGFQFRSISVHHCLQSGGKILFVRAATIPNHQLVATPNTNILQTRFLYEEAAPKDVAPHLRPEHEFKVSKALIVSKLSRLELEQHRHNTLNQPQLEKLIRDRGTDYESLVYHHHLHKNFQQRIAQSFTELGVQVQLANR